MKFEVISDMHLDFDKDKGATFVNELEPVCDTLVIAGDVGEFTWWNNHPELIAALTNKYRNVLFVPGNHDYYRTTFWDGARFFKNIPRVTTLIRDVVTVDGVTFAGATLWFRNSNENARYSRYLGDFTYVKGFVPSVYVENSSDREFLDTVGRVDVVITHHYPSSLSIHPMYAGDELNRFFHCDMEDTIIRVNPKVWIHGHTHKPFDYTFGETRVICNPRGYPGENHPIIYKPKVVEV